MNAPTRCPSDCWDWLTPAEATRHALAAFAEARGSIHAPDGERWNDGFTTWADRGTFRDAFLAAFVQRVNTQALAAGLGAPVSLYRDLPPGLMFPDLEVAS